LNIAEGAGNEISSMLQRMRELAVQSSNDTLTSTERAYTHQEFNALRNEINRISQVTNYNKQELISSTAGRFGSTAANNLWIDANTTQGVDNVTISIGTMDVPTLSANLSTRDITTQAHAVLAISEVDAALNSVNSVRANLGAYINRLEHAINNLNVSNTNQQAAESSIRDVDFASETSQYTKNQILMQSGTAMLSQANMIPSSVLTLLK
jgi:flagellin